MTSSLSDTFAPPSTATKGRSGMPRRAQVLDLVRHQQSGNRVRT